MINILKQIHLVILLFKGGPGSGPQRDGGAANATNNPEAKIEAYISGGHTKDAVQYVLEQGKIVCQRMIIIGYLI